MKPVFLLVPTALVAMAASPSAHAYDEDNWFNSPWRLYVGAFHASVDSKLSINSESGDIGDVIDVEDLLGVEDSKTTAWGGASWQFARRHSVEFEAFTLNRGASTTETFDPPIEIGDFTIESGGVGTSYDTSIARLTYGFSAIRNDRSNLKLQAGLHVARLEAVVQLTGNICSPDTTPSAPPGCPPDNAASVDERVTAPLPHFGANWSYSLAPSWSFDVGAIGFAIEVDNIDGSIIEVDTDVVWHPWENFGFGLGVRYFKVDVESQGSDLNGKFQFEYLGPTFFVAASF